MAHMPNSYIPPNVIGNNFTGAQATPAFQGSNINPPGVDFPPINNATYPPTFPTNPSMSQQNENSFPHSGGFLGAPQFTQPPGWPPRFNRPPPSFYGQPSNFFPGVQPPSCAAPVNAFPPPNQAFVGQQWTGFQSGPSVEHISSETDDVSWIQFWLNCRVRGQPSTKYPVTAGKTIKVFEMKKLLQDSCALLNELESMEKELTSNFKELSETDWISQLKNVESKKELFLKNFKAVDEVDLKEIKKVLEKRSKKRLRDKRKRQAKKEITAQKFENRKKLHLETDIWLEKQKSEVELLKQEEAMKQEADAVLWGVRRKQSEGRKTLALLSALVKLYQVRSKKKQEALPTEDLEQFTKIIDKLAQLWESQMKDYEMEEKTLREMLQESPQEKKKDELKESMNRVEKCIREWKSVLFGDKANLPLDDAFAPFFLQPSHDMAALIDTRSQWDQYISFSPSSSAIPIGWVIPKEPSSEEWKKSQRE